MENLSPDSRLELPIEQEVLRLRKKVATLESSLKSAHDLIRIAPAFFGYVSLQGEVLDLNDLALQVIEASRDQIIGKLFWECPWWQALPDSAQRIREAIVEGAKGVPAQFDIEYWAIQKGVGHKNWVAISVTPFRNSAGSITHVAVAGIDITSRLLARKHVEEALANLESERELRESFIASLTHDLRTPLTAAKLSAQMIARKIPDPLKLQAIAGRISDNIDRADLMIRDLLDATRIKAGEKLPLNLNECDLNELTKSTLEDLAMVQGDRFVMKAAEQINGYWDYHAIRRVIENLVNNAVKYGSGITPITVALKQKEEIVEISIHNYGNPIPEKDQQGIFEPFYRSDSATKSSQKGWGIGLTLVRGLIEAHGGKAVVKSSAIEGTTFLIQIPRDSRTLQNV